MIGMSIRRDNIIESSLLIDQGAKYNMKKISRLPSRSERLGLFLLLVVAAAAAMAALARAAPLPPRRVVNHQTQQCAEIVPGDECGDVLLPPGWEYTDGECPAGYTPGEIQVEWVHFEVSICCTEGHSGVAGDCQDVVIQRSLRQCAFVGDIEKCAGLPNGWEALGRDCPVEFTWVEDVVCPAVGLDQAGPRTPLPTAGPAGVGQPTTRPQNTPVQPAGNKDQTGSWLPGGICTGPAALGLIGIAVFLVTRYFRG